MLLWWLKDCSIKDTIIVVCSKQMHSSVHLYPAGPCTCILSSMYVFSVANWYVCNHLLYKPVKWNQKDVGMPSIYRPTNTQTRRNSNYSSSNNTSKQGTQQGTLGTSSQTSLHQWLHCMSNNHCQQASWQFEVYIILHHNDNVKIINHCFLTLTKIGLEVLLLLYISA